MLLATTEYSASLQTPDIMAWGSAFIARSGSGCIAFGASRTVLQFCRFARRKSALSPSSTLTLRPQRKSHKTMAVWRTSTHLSKVHSSSVILISGDFNAKLGGMSSQYRCIGHYGRGRRNFSGAVLADFCDAHHLFACNSAFQHPARHQTTWTGWRKGPQDGVSIPIYNQIDYIFCLHRQRQLLVDSRSYSGTLVESDHRLVVARLDVSRIRHVWSSVEHGKKQRASQRILVGGLSDPTMRRRYCDELESSLTGNRLDNTNCPSTTWNGIRQTVITAARNTLGVAAPRKRGGKWIMDADTLKMSCEKRRLRHRIRDEKNADEVSILKQQRNKLSHMIRQHACANAASHLDEKAREIENQKDGAQMFRAVHLLQRKKQSPIVVNDASGKLVLRPMESASIIRNHFSAAFADSTCAPLHQENKPLRIPISEVEVRSAARRLNNGRAIGPDDLPAELIKYGPAPLHRHLADL